uniref:Smr domain-containing protein n=1 Tax=Caenorhabditis tropicalis TaxID=1561998 RepID=A0A1I7TCH8_9PELO
MSSRDAQFIAAVKCHCGRRYKSLFEYDQRKYSFNAHSYIDINTWLAIVPNIFKEMKLHRIRRFKFICGKGIHSESGVSILQPILVAFFKGIRGCEIVSEEENEGVVEIRLNYTF